MPELTTRFDATCARHADWERGCMGITMRALPPNVMRPTRELVWAYKQKDVRTKARSASSAVTLLAMLVG